MKFPQPRVKNNALIQDVLERVVDLRIKDHVIFTNYSHIQTHLSVVVILTQ